MNNVLVQGLVLTVVGMGLVFAILALLWGIMALMGRVGRPRTAKVSGTVEIVAAAAVGAPDEDEIAAIAAALAVLRQEREAHAARPQHLPSALTRWIAIGYGRQLQRWHPLRNRRDS